MTNKIIVEKKRHAVFGKAFLGNKATEKVKIELPKGYKPPGKGHDKPFNYKLWNTLKKMGRVSK